MPAPASMAAPFEPAMPVPMPVSMAMPALVPAAMTAPTAESGTIIAKPAVAVAKPTVAGKPFSVFLPLMAVGEKAKTSASPATTPRSVTPVTRQSIFNSTPKDNSVTPRRPATASAKSTPTTTPSRSTSVAKSHVAAVAVKPAPTTTPVRSVSASTGRPSLTSAAGRPSLTASHRPQPKATPTSARKNTMPVLSSATKAKTLVTCREVVVVNHRRALSVLDG
jgi:hypothetical protein